MKSDDLQLFSHLFLYTTMMINKSKKIKKCSFTNRCDMLWCINIFIYDLTILNSREDFEGLQEDIYKLLN